MTVYSKAKIDGKSIVIVLGAADDVERAALEKAMRKLGYPAFNRTIIKGLFQRWLEDIPWTSNVNITVIRGTIDLKEFPFDIEHTTGDCKMYISIENKTVFIVKP